PPWFRFALPWILRGKGLHWKNELAGTAFALFNPFSLRRARYRGNGPAAAEGRGGKRHSGCAGIRFSPAKTAGVRGSTEPPTSADWRDVSSSVALGRPLPDQGAPERKPRS